MAPPGGPPARPRRARPAPVGSAAARRPPRRTRPSTPPPGSPPPGSPWSTRAPPDGGHGRRPERRRDGRVTPGAYHGPASRRHRPSPTPPGWTGPAARPTPGPAQTPTRGTCHVTDVTLVEAAPRAGRREWIGLAVLALACLLYVMDLTVLHLAVPAISADLRPTSAQLLWIIDVYGFFVAGSLITMGTLSRCR